MADELYDVLSPLLAAAGLELVDVEVRSRAVRVTVDRPGGVDLDSLAAANRLVSAALDEMEPIAGSLHPGGLEPGAGAPAPHPGALRPGGGGDRVRPHAARRRRRPPGAGAALGRGRIGVRARGPRDPRRVARDRLRRGRAGAARCSNGVPSRHRHRVAGRRRAAQAAGSGRRSRGEDTRQTERVTTP